MSELQTLIVTIVSSLGGIEGIKWLIRFLVNRKTDARKEDAAADSLENENERKQVAWLEDRVNQRDTKIDALYIELREEQAAKLDLIYKLHECELKLKEAEIRRCDIRKCKDREPPSDY